MGANDDLLEHALYHVIVGRIESYFDLDPCPAIKAANALTGGIMAEARAYADHLAANQESNS